MRIGSGVQSVSELFGKRQNNSKTSVNGNEAFPQTSMKVYLKTDDMLFSGGNGTGLSFYIKYAEESTDDNPVVIAKETGHMGLNERCDLISSFEKVIQDMNKLGKYDLQMFYMRNMNTYLNLERQKKA